MRYGAAFSLLFLLAGAGAAAAVPQGSTRLQPQSASLLDDIVRLTQTGFSDETILVYVKAHRAELPSVLSADDLLWLKKSRVSEAVIRYLAGLSAIDVGESGDGRQAVAYDSQEDVPYPADPYGYGYPSGYDGYYGSYYGYPGYYGGGSFSHYPGHFFAHHHGSSGHGDHHRVIHPHGGAVRSAGVTAHGGGHAGGFTSHGPVGGHSIGGHSGGGHSGGGHSGGGHSGGGHSGGGHR